MFDAFEMSAADLTDAMAYYAAEPYGAWKDDLHMGTALSMFHAMHKNKKDKGTQWHDWFPNAQKPETTVQQRVSGFKAALMKHDEEIEKWEKRKRDPSSASRNVPRRPANPRTGGNGKSQRGGNRLPGNPDKGGAGG